VANATSDLLGQGQHRDGHPVDRVQTIFRRDNAVGI
jgi:hypothetical protein